MIRQRTYPQGAIHLVIVGANPTPATKNISLDPAQAKRDNVGVI